MAAEIRRGARVKIEHHINKRLVGLTGRVKHLERPTGLVPGHEGGAWVVLDGFDKQAWCRRSWLAPIGDAS